MPRLREFRWDSWSAFALRRFEEDRPGVVAVDTETTGVGFYDRPFAATLTWRTPAGDLQSTYFDLEAPGWEARAETLGHILRATPVWAGHNVKFDLQKLLLVGVVDRAELDRHTIHDTQILYHLLDENSPKGLKKLAVSVLHYDDTIEVEIKSGPNKGKTKRVPKEEHRLGEARRKLKLRKEDGYHLLPRELLIPYALRDTEFTLLLLEKLCPTVEMHETLGKVYLMERQLTLVLLDMEADGFDLDLPYLQESASAYGLRVMEGWMRIVDLVGDPEFNPNSPAQVKAAFARRGVRLDDTQADTLRGLDDELAHTLLQYREDSKIHKTYLLGLLSDQRDGRVHPSFNQTGARTGRMSSGSAKE